MLAPVLDARQQALLAEERGLLGSLQVQLARLDLPVEDQEALARSIAQLDQLFLLVVVGEFNAGKSAFINALLGERILEEGVTPTTTRVGLLRYGPAVGREPGGAGLDHLTAPVEVLRGMAIVDTPGTNAVAREHEALTRDFVPRSDLVLFVSSADRPFTESERAFLQAIREWGKKVVIVVNKIDILGSDPEVGEVVAFVADRARALLGFSPDVFPVSSRLAQRAKGGETAALAPSRFPALERYVSATLDADERLRLKLLNPLGVGAHLLDRHLAVTEERLELLREDVATVDDIERQLALYKEDLTRDFRFRLSDVEKVLLEFERRGLDFFDATLRLGRVFDLVNQSKLKREFEKTVIADLPRLVERRVSEVIDWMVASDMRQWQAVMERLERRRLHHGDRMLGRVGGGFEYDRARLLERVQREAQRAVETYDQEAEASRLADSVQKAVASVAALQVGALGLGTVLVILATTTMADVTGILAAGAMSLIGLLVLPAKRERAKNELRGKVAAMRERLMGALTSQFDHELEHNLVRLQEAMGPYTRFVRSERARLADALQSLRGLRDSLHALKERVEGL
jgi:small GTP-binding protein